MSARSGRPGLLLLFTALVVGSGGCGGAEGPTAPREDDEGPAAAPTYVQAVAGARHTCALDDGGRAWCWGFNGDQQLGVAPGARAGIRPAPVRTDLRFASLTAGSAFTCGRTSGGAVHCWGTPFWTRAPLPERLGPSPPLSAVESRFDHLCGVTTSRSVVCVGPDSSGQLGRGEHGVGAGAAAPVPVPGLDDVRQLATGVTFTCARDGEGRVWCWGAHDAGALGLGTLEEGPCRATEVPFPCAPSPRRVTGLPAVTDLVAGYYHVCALTTDGRVLCWGDHEARQLGAQADTETCVWAEPSGSRRPCAPRPREIEAGRAAFASLRAGGFHTCGLTGEGEAHCWGGNDFGQLGLGRAFSPDGPRPVDGDLRWRDLALGQVHTCGVTVEGDAYCWGSGGFNQLGAGRGQAPVPAPVLPPGG